MDISYFGHSSFKIKGKSGSVVTDPFNPHEVGFKFSGISADLVTISHDHGDHNRAELVLDSPFVINGPGEYEVKSLFVTGVAMWHDDQGGAKRGRKRP